MESIYKGTGLAEMCEVETETEREDKAETEFRAVRNRSSLNPSFCRRPENSSREKLNSPTEKASGQRTDSHPLMQCFSKFNLLTVADLPTIYYSSKHFIMSRNK